jgi:peptide/nickel transport system permease protein
VLRLIIRRVILTTSVILGVTVITFVLSHVIPGDPARLIAGPRANSTTLDQIRQSYGLDQPLPIQYRVFIRDLLHGDFGTSFVTRRSVGYDLAQAFPATLELILYAMIIGTVLAVIAAVLGAHFRLRRGSGILQLAGISGVSLPSFWVALVLQLYVAGKLGWFPVAGRLSPGVAPPPRITGLYTLDSVLSGQWGAFADAFGHLALPVVALALPVFGLTARIMRVSLLEVVGENYVRTAKSKGISPFRVMMWHILRNALLPSVTVLGLQFATLAGGVFIVEYIFAWPGIGRYAFIAISANDYNAIMAVTLVGAVVYVLANLVVDMAYMYVDPRVRIR